MKINLSKNMKKANKGITLIALVITIIVLLILAGVSIAMLTGDNGILTQASKAKEETEKAEIRERLQLEVLGEMVDGNINLTTLSENINKNIPGANANEDTGKIEYNGEIYAVDTTGKITGPIEGEFAKPGEKVTGEKNKLYINDGVAVIPVGFAIVRGCDKVSEGLVISDNENDTELDEDLTKHVSEGNQFVWIPVDKNNFATEFVRREGKYIENGEEKTQDITYYGEANGTGNNTNASIKETDETKAEAIAMYDSVEENGGFYIGRYEAGTTVESGSGRRESVICKKGANVYNNIGWNNDTANNSITMETGGAVELARNFATAQGYDTTKVHSTLCYGVQWDTALNFIDPGYIGYAKDSSKKGWYTDNHDSTTTGNTETNPKHITGKDLIYTSNSTVIANKHKNIYDMGGNVYEWTMEACDTSSRACRGGDYGHTGSNLPASRRYNNYPSDAVSIIGFRLALYL